MKPFISIFLFILLTASTVIQAQTSLKAGDKAPDFVSKDQNVRPFHSGNLKGKN